MPCSTSGRPRPVPQRRLDRLTTLLRAWLLLLLFLPLLLVPGTSRADGGAIELSQTRLERTEEGVFLSANLRFDLPPTIEDALQKGIPMFFVAEATLYRDRWYWADKQLVTATRYLRLAYQPLTRRWRLTVAPTAIANAGLVLGQVFESREEALAAMQRIYRWKIAEAAEVDSDARHNADFRFRLDVSQLPRPFQIGAVGQSDWNLSVSRNLRLVAAEPAAAKPAEPPPTK